MKKQTISTLIIVFLMIAPVLAVTLSPYLTKDKVSPVLANADATDYSIEPIVCNSDECEPICIDIDRDTGEVDEYNQTIYEGVVHKCYNPEPDYQSCKTYDEELEECTEWETLYYTNAELETKRDNWESSVITTAESYLSKVEEEKTEKVAGVDVTIKSK